MPAVAALLDNRAALSTLRRQIPREVAPVVACRSADALERTMAGRLVEAAVLGTRAIRELDFEALRGRFPGIPVVAYGVIRSDDADLLIRWQRLDAVAVVVEGVDDPMVGDLVARNCVSARRRVALADAPRVLRLTEPLQRRAWDLLVSRVGRPPRTSQLARSLGMSREHLSRQFGAGGAPNLKRVADLLTVLAALQLLHNPGYQLARVPRLLGLSTPSHLRAMVRRITGLPLPDALELSEREVLARFARRGARSRT